MGNILSRDGKGYNALAELNILLDNREVVITKQNFTWTALFAMVGGIQKTIKLLFFFLSAVISKKLFMASVLEKLYFIEAVKDADDDVTVIHGDDTYSDINKEPGAKVKAPNDQMERKSKEVEKIPWYSCRKEEEKKKTFDE